MRRVKWIIGSSIIIQPGGLSKMRDAMSWLIGSGSTCCRILLQSGQNRAADYWYLHIQCLVVFDTPLRDRWIRGGTLRPVLHSGMEDDASRWPRLLFVKLVNDCSSSFMHIYIYYCFFISYLHIIFIFVYYIYICMLHLYLHIIFIFVYCIYICMLHLCLHIIFIYYVYIYVLCLYFTIYVAVLVSLFAWLFVSMNVWVAQRYVPDTEIVVSGCMRRMRQFSFSVWSFVAEFGACLALKRLIGSLISTFWVAIELLSDRRLRGSMIKVTNNSVSIAGKS